ncbi:hypothetical protein BB559_006360 [Furculomyces boomerangus]|uniref:Uncharacterized protein n=1 Tax=Furculomyces boomerangus TaxID=61424 RepID=A0A2T9Y3J3_9FUNG|nr:hypothetical protein BB559_006360 [Furculomyces boomerangus]
MARISTGRKYFYLPKIEQVQQMILRVDLTGEEEKEEWMDIHRLSETILMEREEYKKSDEYAEKVLAGCDFEKKIEEEKPSSLYLYGVVYLQGQEIRIYIDQYGNQYCI